MNDGQKQTINYIYHFLKDQLHRHPPNDRDIRNMVWYLEANFPWDILKHEIEDEIS